MASHIIEGLLFSKKIRNVITIALDMRDPFQVLGVEPNATQDQIRVAYKSRVKVLHPDRLSGNSVAWKTANEMLRELNEAYAYLKSDAAIEMDSPATNTGTSYDEPRRAPNEQEDTSDSDEIFSEETPLKRVIRPNASDDRSGSANRSISQLLALLILVSGPVAAIPTILICHRRWSRGQRTSANLGLLVFSYFVLGVWMLFGYTIIYFRYLISPFG